jgi:hypothetical protein
MHAANRRKVFGGRKMGGRKETVLWEQEIEIWYIWENSTLSKTELKLF